MCGRYYRIGDKQAIAEEFHAGILNEVGFTFAPAYNVAPTTMQPIVRESRDTDAREIVSMRWGLVGRSTAGPDIKRATFNARAETLESSPLWRTPFHQRRCLVPVSGFYEWRKADRVPLRFEINGAPLFALAGLWNAWQNPADDSWLQSFAIITTEANEIMAPIHDRMPVILRREDYSRWLSRSDPAQPPTDLLQPFDAHRMTMAPAHPKVGNVRNQGADMLNSQ